MSVQKATAAIHTSPGFSDLLEATNRSHMIEKMARRWDPCQLLLADFQSACVT